MTLLLLFTACGLLGGDEAAPPPAAPAAPPSLVVVTMDTTRADRLGAYGYTSAHTPTLDRFAQEGLRFARAYATVPLTTPSHSSMFTGLYPPRHGVHTNGDAVLPAELDTLAERLRGAGYRTGASVAAFVTTRIWGLHQGFDAYFDTMPSGANQQRWAQERPADQVVDDAVKWLSTPEEGPFFLWVHLYDPHDPYRPPAEWMARTQGRPYDGEVAFMDHQIGRLREAVDKAAGPAGAAWVLIADHGEALGEAHGEERHGLFLYDETMRIPFIVRPAQALPSPKVVEDLTVSNVDLMPTALGLLGQPVPEGLDGVDLSPLLRDGTVQRGPAYLESFTAADLYGYHPEVAVAEGTLKLMATPKPRLYDLATDPKETASVLDARPDDVARLNSFALQVRATTREASTGGSVSAEVMDQLAALGYMSSGRDLDRAYEFTEDAKEHLDTLDALEKARALVRDPAKAAEAEAAYRAILAREPQLGEARTALATVLLQQGRHDEAIALLQEALAQDPSSTVLHFSLARAFGMARRPQDALLEYEAILAQVPGDIQARAGALRAMSQLGRDQDALARGEVWLAETPEEPALQAAVGVLRLRTGRGAEAEALLRASLVDGIPRPMVHEGLARAATARGDGAEVERHLQAELASFPNNRSCRRALARIYASAKRWDDAAAEYKLLVEAFPKDLPARVDWAQALFNAGDVAGAEATLAPVLLEAPRMPEAMLLQANILAMQGKREEGEVLAREAQALYKAQRAQKAASQPGALFDEPIAEPIAGP